MLLGPQLDQAVRQPGPHGQQPVDPGMAGRAGGDEPFRIVATGFSVMDMEGLPSLPCPTDRAPAIALEDFVAVSGKACAGVGSGPVAGAAEAGGDRDAQAAGAEEGALAGLLRAAGSKAEWRGCASGSHGVRPPEAKQQACLLLIREFIISGCARESALRTC